MKKEIERLAKIRQKLAKVVDIVSNNSFMAGDKLNDKQIKIVSNEAVDSFLDLQSVIERMEQGE